MRAEAKKLQKNEETLIHPSHEHCEYNASTSEKDCETHLFLADVPSLSPPPAAAPFSSVNLYRYIYDIFQLYKHESAYTKDSNRPQIKNGDNRT